MERAELRLRGSEGHQVASSQRFAEAVAALTVTCRERWMAEHPTEANWTADLAQRVSSRRCELGLAAEASPPPHVLRLLGPPPVHTADRERWLTKAGGLEACREQWRVEPDQLGRKPNLQGAQGREVNDARQPACPRSREAGLVAAADARPGVRDRPVKWASPQALATVAVPN